MADTNKVTIDAAYFNHLFTRAVERERLWSDREGLILENEKIAKERDELKRTVSRMDKPGEKACGKLRERIGELEAKLAAAERCIEDIYSKIDCKEADEVIGSIIRAYREKKEAK